jgi:hypothetical protein
MVASDVCHPVLNANYASHYKTGEGPDSVSSCGLRLSFQFASSDLPFPAPRPFVLPILNSLGSFHAGTAIRLPSFVLISHPAPFPT